MPVELIRQEQHRDPAWLQLRRRAVRKHTDGRKTATTEQPFTDPWQLRWIGYDPELQRSRVLCRVAIGDKTVTAIIDAADFRQLRGNNSRTSAWNESGYHDMAVLASTLIQEQVLTWDPSKLGSTVRIKLPADR